MNGGQDVVSFQRVSYHTDINVIQLRHQTNQTQGSVHQRTVSFVCTSFTYQRLKNAICPLSRTCHCCEGRITWWLIFGCEDSKQILWYPICRQPINTSYHYWSSSHNMRPTTQHALTSRGSIPDAPIFVWRHLLEYPAKLKVIKSSPKVEVPIVPASNISSGTIIIWSRREERLLGKSNRYNPYSATQNHRHCHISIVIVAPAISPRSDAADYNIVASPFAVRSQRFASILIDAQKLEKIHRAGHVIDYRQNCWLFWRRLSLKPSNTEVGFPVGFMVGQDTDIFASCDYVMFGLGESKTTWCLLSNVSNRPWYARSLCLQSFPMSWQLTVGPPLRNRGISFGWRWSDASPTVGICGAGSVLFLGMSAQEVAEQGLQYRVLWHGNKAVLFFI